MRVVALVCVLAALGCTSSERPSPERAAPSYRLVLDSKDIDGTAVGVPGPETRATVVVFFASWCGPCQRELGVLDELVKTDSALRVIGINAYEEWSDRSDERKLRAFVSDNAPWLEVVTATPELMAAFSGVPKIPTVFVFDAEGQLVEEFRRDRRDPPGKEELAKAIATAKAGPAS